MATVAETSGRSALFLGQFPSLRLAGSERIASRSALDVNSSVGKGRGILNAVAKAQFIPIPPSSRASVPWNLDGRVRRSPNATAAPAPAYPGPLGKMVFLGINRAWIVQFCSRSNWPNKNASRPKRPASLADFLRYMQVRNHSRIQA